MELEFTKMHGCGNDYIYVDGFKYDILDKGELSKRLSDRHFSVGGDGVIYVCPSDKADAFMRMFNADGSEGKMCGNGVRCVAKFVYDYKISEKDKVKIETLSGIKTIELKIEDGKATGGTVDMGKAEFDPKKIPVNLPGKAVIAKEVNIGGREYKITCVSMGNPHCVIFVPEDFDLEGFDIEKEGRIIEKAPLFPEGVNTEFVKVIGPDTLLMRVWERGSGETLACGTGACASVAAAVKNSLVCEGKPVTVKLLGGELSIVYTEDKILMTGNAVTAFHGTVLI